MWPVRLGCGVAAVSPEVYPPKFTSHSARRYLALRTRTPHSFPPIYTTCQGSKTAVSRTYVGLRWVTPA